MYVKSIRRRIRIEMDPSNRADLRQELMRAIVVSKKANQIYEQAVEWRAGRKQWVKRKRLFPVNSVKDGDRITYQTERILDLGADEFQKRWSSKLDRDWEMLRDSGGLMDHDFGLSETECKKGNVQ